MENCGGLLKIPRSQSRTLKRRIPVPGHTEIFSSSLSYTNWINLSQTALKLNPLRNSIALSHMRGLHYWLSRQCSKTLFCLFTLNILQKGAAWPWEGLTTIFCLLENLCRGRQRGNFWMMYALPTFSQKMVWVMWEYWKLAVQGYQAYWETPSFKSITLVRHICSRKEKKHQNWHRGQQGRILTA